MNTENQGSNTYHVSGPRHCHQRDGCDVVYDHFYEILCSSNQTTHCVDCLLHSFLHVLLCFSLFMVILFELKNWPSDWSVAEWPLITWHRCWTGIVHISQATHTQCQMPRLNINKSKWLKWGGQAKNWDVNETRLDQDLKKILDLENYISRPSRILRIWIRHSRASRSAVSRSCGWRFMTVHQSVDRNWVKQEEVGGPPPSAQCEVFHGLSTWLVFKAASIPDWFELR